jgi:hypothetical protein
MNSKAAPSAFGTSPKYDGTSVVFGGGRVGVETTVINRAQQKGLSPSPSPFYLLLFTHYILKTFRIPPFYARLTSTLITDNCLL